MTACSEFVHEYTKSPFRYREPSSKDYEVFANGKQVPVYTCRISKFPFNRPWPGHQRAINQTELASFVNIISDERVDIEIIMHKEHESVYVDKDALVFGCLFAEGAKNIRVFGNGLFDDMGEERYFVHCYEPYPVGNLKFYNCENVKVEGVLFRNIAVSNISVNGKRVKEENIDISVKIRRTFLLNKAVGASDFIRSPFCRQE